MTGFWFAALALAGLAIVFVLAPLLRSRDGASDAALRRASNKRIFADRRAEIRAEAASGELSEAEAQALETELARSLLRDAAGSDELAPRDASRSDRTLLLGAAVSVPLLAIMLYADWGLSIGALADVELSRDAAVLDRLAAGEAPEHGAEGADVVDLEVRLAARLAANPEDIDGWFLLGRTRLNLENFAGAAEAFGEIADRLPDVPGPRIYQAQARYMADGRQVTPAVRTLIDQVLELTPGEPVVLELLAMDDFQNRRYAAAAERFEQVLASGVQDPARRQFLADGLARARSLAGLPPLESGSEAGPGVDVAVEIDPALIAEAGPDAALFVVARAPGGPPMPLAVERHAPTPSLRLRLDGSDAMSEALSIATAERVEIVARLSRGGTAARSAGDVEATAGPLGNDGAVRLVLGSTNSRGEVLRASGAAVTGAPAAAPAATAEPNAPAEPTGSDAGPTLRVLVELDAAHSAPADATLFVFAREVGGPPMPLAVARLQASSLPALVTLDDSMAMMPGRTLSAAQQVQIVARITRSGGVVAEAGDLEGEIGPVDPSASPRVLPLLVDRVVR